MTVSTADSRDISWLIFSDMPQGSRKDFFFPLRPSCTLWSPRVACEVRLQSIFPHEGRLEVLEVPLPVGFLLDV